MIFVHHFEQFKHICQEVSYSFLEKFGGWKARKDIGWEARRLGSRKAGRRGSWEASSI
jgi:hypothetical protein